jgi:creatinine amidohydrolase
VTGYSIFEETMVDMTYPEVVKAATRGAVVLLPSGVVEQHGPHLPIGVDTYGSYLQAKLVRREMSRLGREAIIAPPFYWGINKVTEGFPATFRTRHETAVMLLTDIFDTLVEDGFKSIFIVNHQGDAGHAKVQIEVMEAQHAKGNTGIAWVEEEPTAKRHGATGTEAYWLTFLMPQETGLQMSGKLGVHAHEVETAMMTRWFPEIVNYDALANLEPTDLNMDDLMAWRKGGEHARRVTPLGYFGDPKPHDPDLWKLYTIKARIMAETILERVGAA